MIVSLGKIRKLENPITKNRITDKYVSLSLNSYQLALHLIAFNKIQVLYGQVHNPFWNSQIRNYFFASKRYGIYNFKKYRTNNNRAMFELTARLHLSITEVNEIEYENFDFFNVLEQLGGLIEIFFVFIGGFIVSSINKRVYINAQNEYLAENAGFEE